MPPGPDPTCRASPPLVYGVAHMASLLYGGASFGDVIDLIGPEPGERFARAAWLLDRAWAHWLNTCPYRAHQLQDEALAICRVFRVRATAGTRLLALYAPGGLMVNAPLDFLAAPAGCRLDLAFTSSSGALPRHLPDHDVAIVAVSESAPGPLAGLTGTFDAWNGPILNDPARILPMSRAWLPDRLSGLPGLLVPAARSVDRRQLEQPWPGLLPNGAWPLLIRPAGSHAGEGLAMAGDPADAARYLANSAATHFTLTQFVEYRGSDGWYGKYRIAFVDGRPFICHRAASDSWMVHYLNAGMATDPAKRQAEAVAMAGFEDFRHRHRAALRALADAIGLDYFSIDCAESPDGRLLLFEVDTAAIIHSMDAPELYPYKRPAMQRCYDAFGAMVRSRATSATEPWPSLGSATACQWNGTKSYR